MSFKRRRITQTGNTAGTLGLGAPFAAILGIKIDYDAGANAATDVVIIDADSRAVYTATDKNTDIDIPLGADSYGYDGVANDASEGVLPMVFKSPLTVTTTGADSNDINVIDIFVEV